MNLYRAPLSFFPDPPSNIKISCDLAPLTPDKLLEGTCRFSRSYRFCAKLVQTQPAVWIVALRRPIRLGNAKLPRNGILAN